MKLRWPKVQWNLKLDPIALTALILAAGAALAQVYAWATGSAVRLITPDRVALYGDVAPDGAIFVRVAAHMSYANLAQGPYGDLVLKERVQLRIGNLTSQQQWNALGTITRKNIEMVEHATPQPLPGQSAVSHFTLFMPPTHVCPPGTDCDPKRDFFTPQMLLAQLDRDDRLQFRFEIELIDGSSKTASCHVPLTERSKQQLANVQTDYAYLWCYPD